MNRETVKVSESKKKIENIKAKYNNMRMSDADANKIMSLEVTNKVLKTAMGIVGTIAFIDIIIPDPVLGLDELALTAITGLLKLGSSIVENKIDAIASSQDASLQTEEITKLTEQLTNAASSVKRSRGMSR